MKSIKLTRAMIDDGSVAEFFAKLKIGDAIGFNRRDFLAENVIEIAAKYGKMIFFPIVGSYGHEKFGDFVAVVSSDIKDYSEKLATTESLSTKKELADCYSRISELEEQLGLRGIHQLVKCEYCRKPIKPNEPNESTSTDGLAHTICVLESEINKLEKAVSKKDDLSQKWRKEAQKLSDDNYSLRVDKSRVEKQLESTTISLKTNEQKNKKNQEDINEIERVIKKIETEQRDLKEKHNNAVTKNENYAILITSVLDIFKKIRDLLGGRGIITNEEEFRPLPAFSMGGELRVELKDSTWSLYKRIIVIINKL